MCVTRERRCESCLLRKACVYPFVFETEAEIQSTNGPRADAVPHPFVLGVEANWRQRTVEEERVEVTLFGRGEQAWAYLIHALREGAQRGLGAERLPLRLEKVEQEWGGRSQWVNVLGPGGRLEGRHGGRPAIPAAPPVVRVRLATPLRIRRQNDLVEQERLGFDELAAAVLRRLALVSRHHTDAGWRMDHAGLRAQAAEARVLDKKLGWQDWARYSSRQERKVPMGGVVGEMVLETAGWEELWPLLWVGQWVHAGKGTSMGLGRYEVEAL